MTKSAGNRALSHTFCATVLSPGTAWQCAVIRERLCTRVTVQIFNRYDGTFHRLERKLPLFSLVAQRDSTWPDVDSKYFRFRMSQSKRSSFLSGFIENSSGQRLMWDLELTPLHRETAWQMYSIQGRMDLDGEESLFPSVSSCLLMETDVNTFRAFACINQPLAAFYLSQASEGLILDNHNAIQLPPAENFGQTGQSVYFFWKNEVAAFTFTPASSEPVQTWQINLPGHRRMITCLGLWTVESYFSENPLPGIYIFVI